MLTRLRIHNFKTFLNFEIDFTRRHLLIGKNNSGKSNLCHVLRFLGASAVNDYEKLAGSVPGGLDGLCHWGFSSREVALECTCELVYEGGPLTYTYALHLRIVDPSTLGAPGKAPFETTLERLEVRAGAGSPVTLLDSDGQRVRLLSGRSLPHDVENAEEQDLEAPTGSSMLFKTYDSEPGRITTLFKRFLSSVGYFSLSPVLMRYGWSEPAFASVSGRDLQMWGQNLPMILFQLKNEDEPRYRCVLDLASLLEPDLDSLNFFATPENKPVPYVIMKGGKRAGWANLSDGTLCALAIGAIFEQAEGVTELLPGWPAPWIVIEEPENSLYRGLLPTLWEKLSGMAPAAQFIFTTHSPYFIDLFDRDLGSVTALTRNKGVTQAKPLLEYKDRIREYRGDFSLGELHFKELFA